MMRKMKNGLLLGLLVIGGLWSGCSKKSSGVKLRTDTDSVAYVIGLNIGANLMKMDSTLNVDAVCKGIADYVAGRQLLSMEEAQTFYLRYVNYALPEKIKGQEEQYLDDVTADGSFRRSSSGLRYDIRREGNAKEVISSDKERVQIRYKLLRRNGETAYSSYERNDTLSTYADLLPAGLREGLKLIGTGGAVNLWSPSHLSYGATGNDTLGVGANEPLYYEAELLDVQPDDRPDKKENDPAWKF